MGLDWETHRVVTPRTRQVRALVYTVSPKWIIMRTRLTPSATKDKSFDSIEELKSFVRQRRWELEEARPFA